MRPERWQQLGVHPINTECPGSRSFQPWWAGTPWKQPVTSMTEAHGDTTGSLLPGSLTSQWLAAVLTCVGSQLGAVSHMDAAPWKLLSCGKNEAQQTSRRLSSPCAATRRGPLQACLWGGSLSAMPHPPLICLSMELRLCPAPPDFVPLVQCYTSLPPSSHRQEMFAEQLLWPGLMLGTGGMHRMEGS